MTNLTVNKQIKSISISKDAFIIDAIKKMDEISRKLLVVVNEAGNYVNVLSIGDIQRSLISDQNFHISIEDTLKLRTETIVANPSMGEDEIRQLMLEHRAEFMPVLENNQLVKIIFWEDLFENVEIPSKVKHDIPVVIMAGGKGTRLRPFTNVIPKPLIPIGEKAVAEIIVNKFVALGTKRFFFSINYLGEMVENYFKRISNKPYSVDFFTEDKPLGTAGSLYLMKAQLKETFVVSNCDILVDQDYSEIIRFHKENNNKITMVAAIKNYGIPYGTLKVAEGGQLLSLCEKPQFNYFINTGLYIVEPDALQHIPENSFFHLTDLIEELINKKENVGVFPINGGAWSDIGEWHTYQETLKQFSEQL